MKNIFITGGAGFIGSALVRKLLLWPGVERVMVFDNMSSGCLRNLEIRDDRLVTQIGNVQDFDHLRAVMAHHGYDTVFHLASNPDIAAAAEDPEIDFRQGTVLTKNVLEAMRQCGVGQIIYPSGSGVYGEDGAASFPESQSSLRPVSTYGASKVAGEAMISAYSAMFAINALVFRFANVVGPRQTHGVGFDFMRRLKENPNRLRILGDGRQKKSYIHVDDVMMAISLAILSHKAGMDVYNVSTKDRLTVKEIADLAVRARGFEPQTVCYDYSGGDRGWKGDVPFVELNSDKLRALGWTNQRTSEEAMIAAFHSML
jgi:UDP-glucose 4-epimerase